MRYIRIWLKGKLIGSPYEEFSLKDFMFFVGQGCITLIPKKDAEHTKVYYLEFVEKVEVCK